MKKEGKNSLAGIHDKMFALKKNLCYFTEIKALGLIRELFLRRLLCKSMHAEKAVQFRS